MEGRVIAQQLISGETWEMAAGCDVQAWQGVGQLRSKRQEFRGAILKDDRQPDQARTSALRVAHDRVHLLRGAERRQLHRRALPAQDRSQVARGEVLQLLGADEQHVEVAHVGNSASRVKRVV